MGDPGTAAFIFHEEPVTGAVVGGVGEAEGLSVNQETVNKIFEEFCLGK